MKWSSLAVLVVGICVGWMGRGLVIENAENAAIREKLDQNQSQLSSMFDQNKRPAPSRDDQTAELSGIRLPSEQNTLPAKTENNESSKTRLAALLNAQEFQKAVSLVYETLQNSEAQGKRRREELIAYLEKLSASENDSLFIDLINAYLGVFYQDIRVLLLLADFNANHHYYNEAIGVYQLAQEYAYELNDEQKVVAAFNTFIQRVDQYLVSQGDWLNLSIVYESANLVGLLNDEQKLRQADLYMSSGDTILALELLRTLLGSKVHEAAQARLSELTQEGGVSERLAKDVAKKAPFGAPIKKRGNQYVAQLTLGEQDNVNLLIDTGASMTTISQSVFDRLSWDTYHTYQGSRMFNTANGIARGSVYVLETVTIGGYVLSNHQIAVMDFTVDESVVGLLGMNTLSLFEFQFDEAQGLLHLSPRS